METARAIQAEIKDSLCLTASVGIGPNKLIAKLASDWRKPEGLTMVEDVDGFLTGLPVSRLWEAGPRTVEKLSKIGVVTVGQLRELDCRYMKEQFGVSGEKVWVLIKHKGHRSHIETKYLIIIERLANRIAMRRLCRAVQSCKLTAWDFFPFLKRLICYLQNFNFQALLIYFIISKQNKNIWRWLA